MIKAELHRVVMRWVLLCLLLLLLGWFLAFLLLEVLRFSDAFDFAHGRQLTLSLV